MTQTAPPSWSRVKAVLADALDLPAQERGSFLDAACEGQPALRARVDDLVRAYSSSASISQEDSPSRFGATLEPRAGEQVGRYRIVRLIGRGGMGAVYEAIDEQLARPVAVKLIGSKAASMSMLKRFELEPRLLARLRHPGIAQIFDAGSVAGPCGGRFPFFAMELVAQARTIIEYAQPLPIPERIALFIRVCEAVTHGHQHSVIHRDLKPANILVDSSGQAKIIDFGIAHAADPDIATATITGEVLGTLRYMSPEQLAGTGDGVDVRADVYALGVVLYELLCGKPPRPDPDNFAVSVREAGLHPPVPLSQLGPGLSGDLETVALKAVEPDRAVRYQSVADFSADLGRVLRHEPVSARPHSAAYQVRMFTRRHRALVGGFVAILAALTLGIIGTSIGLVRARAAEQRAVAQTRRSQRIASFLKNTIRSADPLLLPQSTLATLDPAIDPWDSWFLPTSSWGPAGLADVGVDGVLRHAAEHLDTEFADDPEVQAEVSILLAYTLGSLGDSKSAVQLLESALAIQLRHFSLDDEALIRTRTLYAGMLIGVGRYTDADTQLRLAMDSARHRLGPLDNRTLSLGDSIAINMGQIHGRQDEGLAMARASIRAVSQARGPDSLEAWMRHLPLIDLLMPRPSAEDRRELIDECHATIEGLGRAAGPDSPPIAHVAWTLAAVLQEDPAALAEAESLQRRALAIDTALSGPDSRAVYDRRTQLCSILLRGRQFDQAEAMAREQLESALRMIGPHSFYTAKAAGRLARILTWREVNSEATERLAHQAAEVSTDEPAEDFASYHHAIWAAAIRLRGHPADAEAALRERIALRGGRQPQPNSAWVESYQYLQLALCLKDQGRTREALEALRTAHDWARQLHDRCHPVLLNILDVETRLDAPVIRSVRAHSPPRSRVQHIPCTREEPSSAPT